MKTFVITIITMVTSFLICISVGELVKHLDKEDKEPKKEIGGAPNVILHQMPYKQHQVYTFTFVQNGRKYMVATTYPGGVAMVEIKD